MRNTQKKMNFFSQLDPRMKIVLLVIFTTTTYMTQNIWPLIWNYALIVGLYMARRLWKSAWKTALLFGILIMLEFLIELLPHNGFHAAISLIVFFLQRISVLFVMGIWISSNMHINDFVSAMQNMHAPQGAVITLAVVFRYIPTVKKEFEYIKSTMKLRNIGLSVKNVLLHPLKTCEYTIVPMVIRSMTIADELSASAITRGLDLETKRTSYRDLRLGAGDVFATVVVAGLVFGGLVLDSIFGKGGM